MQRSRKSAIAPGIGQLALIATTTAVLTAKTAIGPLTSVAGANEQTINISQMGAGVSRDVKLGLNKAVVVDLPADAHDILVADPSVADAVTRSSRRIYIPPSARRSARPTYSSLAPTAHRLSASTLRLNATSPG